MTHHAHLRTGFFLTTALVLASAVTAHAVPVTITARDAGNATLASATENIAVGAAGHAFQLSATGAVAVSLTDLGNDTCAGGTDATPAAATCTAGAARRWSLETGAVTGLPDATSIVIEVKAPAEICECTSTGSQEQCCGGDTLKVTDDADGGTHELKFLRPAAHAPCDVPITGECSGVACATIITMGDDRFIQLQDTDGNGLCEWPSGSTNVLGEVRFTPNTWVEFSDNTRIQAGHLHVEAGGLLVGVPDTTFDTFAARRLELIATADGIESLGKLDIRLSDDLIIEAKKGDVALKGSTTLVAIDRMRITARQGDVLVTGSAADPALLAALGQLDVAATGPQGDVELKRAYLSSRKLNVSNRSNLSVVGPKTLTIAEFSILTTDSTRSGIGTNPTANDLTLEATGPIVITDHALLDSGRNIRIQAKRNGAQVCLSNSVTLEAANGTGRIHFTNDDAPNFDDGTTTFIGKVLGTILPGFCGPPPTSTPPVPTPTPTGPTPTPTLSATPTPTTTATPILENANFRFYARINRTGQSATNVDVPKHAADAPIEVAILQEHIAEFTIGDQMTASEIADLGGDTLARLSAAIEAYITAHPTDYPAYAGLDSLRWAKRVP